ncbi:hypothetical protein COJ85_29550 [Bacillus sp. AFS076308]|uniref:SpoIID/LytB domain-containing protein n=1 Tax=Bacillus sp. AFS076308 TaxID=2033512 RepID=UPI000BF39F5F|nr:SpoIID/LytB domain-containing protein [Bacillus sp. AFS076308]PFN80567.1 hypothetical protein COJ85_29550 [Bacillus sp. AFS076308]
MKKLLIFVVMAFILIGIKPSPKAAAGVEPQIKVELKKYLANKTSISLGISGSYLINGTNTPLNAGKTYLLKVGKGKDGTPVIKIYDGETEIASEANLSINTINRTDYALFDNHGYFGNFTFTVENGQYIKIVNTIYLEDYIKCVVPSEMYSNWHKEAFKAQAVAARGYAYVRKDSVIDDTTKYQAYEGIARLTDNTTAAARETAGEMVTYDGSVIEALFSSSNGGMTENNKNEFGTTLLPYFPIQKDDFDTEYVWSPAIKKQQINTDGLDLSHPEAWWDTEKEANSDITANIKAWLNNNGYSNKEIKIVSILNLSFYDRTESGRVIHGDIEVNFFVKDKLDAQGKLQLLTIRKTGIADDVRDIIGRTVIKSTLITNLTETNDSFTVAGAGYGHGVGMSQYGANNRANKGILYKDILAFYYKGTDVTKIYDANDLYSIKIQLNGRDFYPGYNKSSNAYINWRVLQTFNIPYTYKGKGVFAIEGRTVQAYAINGDWYINWSQVSPGKVQLETIAGGFNFIYNTPLKIQLNGQDFKEGYLKDSTAYVNWTALKTFKIPYTYKGKGVFDIEDRTVQAYAINGDWYINWSQLSPGKIQFEKIAGGFNFIYYTPLKIQLNGQDFKVGYQKDNTTYVNWTALKTLNIPYTYKGKGVFEIEGRTVQASAINGDWYIRWYQLSSGKITFTQIDGGFNFIFNS